MRKSVARKRDIPRAFTINALAKVQTGGTDFDQAFLAQAPIALAFCTHASRSADPYGERGVGLYCIQDATIACAYAMLAATALELSSVWVGTFDEGKVIRIINAT